MTRFNPPARHRGGVDQRRGLQANQRALRRYLSTQVPGRIIDEGSIGATDTLSLSAQQVYVNVGLDKTFTGLDPSRTYRLHVSAQASPRIALTGTDHDYASRWNFNGTTVDASLGTAHGGGSWGSPMSSSRVHEFTGVSSFALDFEVQSSEVVGPGRVSWRDISWTLREIA